MIRVAFGIATFLVLIIFSTVGASRLLSDQTHQKSFTQKSLRSILLKQPDFRAELEYEKEDGLRTVDQVETVMKRGDMYRFEVPEQNSIDGKTPLILLAYPSKEMRVMFPKEKSWSIITEVNLMEAAFTTLAGVDIYYLTKIVQDKDSKFEYISAEEVNGYSCLKIQVDNEMLLNSQAVRFEKIYLISAPLYFYVSPAMNNLVIAVTGTDAESKEEGSLYMLKNISLDESRVPKELFQVPSNFRKEKSER